MRYQRKREVTNFFLTYEKADAMARRIGFNLAVPVRVANGYRVRVYNLDVAKRWFHTYVDC